MGSGGYLAMGPALVCQHLFFFFFFLPFRSYLDITCTEINQHLSPPLTLDITKNVQRPSTSLPESCFSWKRCNSSSWNFAHRADSSDGSSSTYYTTGGSTDGNDGYERSDDPTDGSYGDVGWSNENDGRSDGHGNRNGIGSNGHAPRDGNVATNRHGSRRTYEYKSSAGAIRTRSSRVSSEPSTVFMTLINFLSAPIVVSFLVQEALVNRA